MASRYVTALREGGSLPAIVEADDDGLYVLKFRGAGQGSKALIAELLAGEIARLAGLSVPEIVFIELPAELARTEPDPEIQSLIRSSSGLNIALDYLPGSITFDPLIFEPEAQLASAIVWLDAFVCNVDRTARNANLLLWHQRLWLIDHGAALYFHHAWTQDSEPARTPFPLIRDHVLLRLAAQLPQTDVRMRSLLHEDQIADLVDLIPQSWLSADAGFDDVEAQRTAYKEFFKLRLKESGVFVEEAIRARLAHV